MSWRRLETAAILAVVLVALALPWLLLEPPSGTREWVSFGCAVCSAASLALWRRSPWVTLTLGSALLVVSAAAGVDGPETEILVATLLAALAGYGFEGRAAWTAGAAFAAFLSLLYLVTRDTSIGLAMLTVPGFLAGTALRLRQRTAEELAVRVRELDEEREQFARLAVRNERARIAAELHDIVGHSLSVMVVQAAAGQRLLDHDPAAVADALDAIAESARQGQDDLGRLVDLLGGEPSVAPDLSLIDELVRRAARSGLRVSCRFEGDGDVSSALVAQVAFRVVQEALTNAIRYAPGSSVRVLVRHEGGRLSVSVTNDAPSGPVSGIVGGGEGLHGLRERVQQLGGGLAAGPAEAGGWSVAAWLPAV